jgi:predicted phage terminase large subunit-like protein
MLQDATLRMFLGLCETGGILRRFNKSDMIAHLVDGKTILLRSADEPDRLRGPNLGWFYLDEAALMSRETWLIMIGRLREQPGRAWATTTPRGFDWLYETFNKQDENHQIIRSSTRDNVYNPPGFLESLLEAYPAEWQAQEVEGEFVSTAGAVFKREWFSQIVDSAPSGLRWIRYWDLATSIKSTADYSCSAAVALADDGVVYIRDMVRGKWEWPDCRRVMMQTMLADPEVEHGVESAMNGLAAFQELQREPMLTNIAFRSIRVDRDKVSRALPLAARAESGKVKLVRGGWIRDAIEELVFFPRGQHDDQVDCISGALQMISSHGWFDAPWVAVSGGEIVSERREGEACEECGSLRGHFTYCSLL